MGKLSANDFEAGPLESGVAIPKKAVVLFDLSDLAIGDSRRIIAKRAGISLYDLKNAVNREASRLPDRKFTYRSEGHSKRPTVRVWRKA